jgi:type III pantothenate kinase
MVAINMIFVCDVGNTHIVMGVFDGRQLVDHWRISTDSRKTEDEFAMIVRELFNYGGLSFDAIDGVAISTVVPSILYALVRMSEKYFHVSPVIVGPGIKTGLNLKYENPRELGADLIVNAVAAVHDYPAPIIVIDFGTATTYSYIDENGDYIGGAVAPGILVSTEALYQQASKLPRIEIAKPPHIVGRNTVHAMQSGVVYGYVGQVEGIVGRMSQQAAKQPVVVATGGLCMLVADETNVINHVDQLLTLKGLYLIYCRNRKS